MSKKVVNPQLTIVRDGGRYCVKLNQGRTTIGRRSDNMVVISDPSVSAHHAAVIISDEEVVIEDLGSTNGTFVNRKQLDMPCKLTNGAEILVGRCRLLFTVNNSSVEPVGSKVSGVRQEKTKVSAQLATSFLGTRTSVPAYLEFLSENKLVIKTMELDKTVNPLGRLGVGVAAISFGRHGWVISPVDGLNPLLNNKAVTATSAVLKNGDVIALGDLQVRFVMQ